MRTLDRVAEAGIAIVSLPMCNLYLQDRVPGRTPRWRGVTLAHEIRARGIPFAMASDNTRDPFHAYGDLDMHEVLRRSAHILQLDAPLGQGIAGVTRVPAAIMGLARGGRIEAGAPADLVIFEGRHWSEVLARPESRRTVLRGGRAIDTTPPAYAELDHLFA
jgi:cytosine deaminase